MIKNKYIKSVPSLTAEELQRRKREVIIIFVIVVVIALLTFAETRIVHYGANFPVSNTILMFILININLLLLILLLYLTLRNLVKLLYDRKRNLMGAKLRTRLVLSFIALSLLPTIVLFYVSIIVITTSIEFWFNVPVEQALANSLKVGQRIYSHVEQNNLFFLKRTAYQVKIRKYLKPEKSKELSNYIKIVQVEFNHHAVEVYSADAERLSYAVAPILEDRPFDVVPSDDLLHDWHSKKAKKIRAPVLNGELVKTIGTIPFGVSREEAEGYIVITILIPPDLSENMKSIERGFEGYQRIKLLKKPIKRTFFSTILLVSLLVVFCAIWFGFYLAKTITIPIMELAEGTQKVAEGDLSFNIGLVADDEIGSLVDSFNKMTRDLRISREQLELSARKLYEQNVEIEERRQYMEIVLRNVSAGVISLDANGFITTINKSAEKMLNLKPENILRKSYKKMLTEEHLHLAREVRDKLASSRNDATELQSNITIDGRPRSFMMHFTTLKDDTGRHMGIVMVFDDLTELHKAQRMAAWREVARRIAHEVKNPLTPISLSAQRLHRKYSDRINSPVFNDCTRTIIDHVDLIRNLVNEFSAFARFPSANPKLCDLQPIIEETVALYREGHKDIEFTFETTDNIPRLNLDRQHIKQALINLVDNAVSAINKKGSISISISHNTSPNIVRLEVADTGSGVPGREKARLFEPYFSTKKSGMGLGLAIVTTIITDHNGSIKVEDNKPKGARFIIEFPVQPRSS